MPALSIGRFVLASLGGLLLGVLVFADVALFGGPELLARGLALAATVGLGVLILRAPTWVKALQRLMGCAALGFLAPVPVVYREIIQARAPHGGSLPAADAAEGAIGIAYFLGAAITALLFVILTVLGSKPAAPAPAAAQPAPAAPAVEED